jgi:hypothetical protein
MAAQSVCKFYNTILWLGADDRGAAQVYMAQGMNPVRVSNPAIENLLNTTASVKLNYTKCFTYQEAGHSFYVMNLCDATWTIVATVVYDLTTGLWHERTYSSPNLWPSCFASVPVFSAGTTSNFIMPDSQGYLYSQSISLANDNGSSITYIRTAPHVCNSLQPLRHSRLTLDADIGTANPVLTYSNDGGRAFGATPSISMQQATDTGYTGTTFKRFWANQLGRSLDRGYKVTITDSANLIRIAAAYLEVQP